MSQTMMVILGMALVTYIPRVIPFVTISDRQLPKYVKQFLEFVPFAALGALIVPGMFSAIEGSWMISLVGVLVAFVIAWKRGGMILPVFASILTVFLLLSI
ncbi:AzlD domain-containing protein [Acidaminobacter sp. JC074]|uniref:AzlD domain-containing protein n=1 Tax=Acidaminobacter sp. JC074 TaxID=2530199 RepID=UPI001F0F3C69|nr:AzlD domain-containing protein [Acidaminobacter sp. JC074]